MPYTVDPNDVTTPLDNQDAEQGAEELRALKASLNEVRNFGSNPATVSGNWTTLWDANTNMNIEEETEYWVSVSPATQFSVYGCRGVLYKSANLVLSIGRIIIPGLADVRMNGANFQYQQNSGGPAAIAWRFYGRKIRTPY